MRNYSKIRDDIPWIVSEQKFPWSLMMTCFAVKMSNTLDPIPEHTRLKGRDVLQILENCSLDLTQSLAFDCGKPHKGLKSPQPPFGRVPSPRNMSRGPCDLAERAKPIWRLPTINATCADRLRQRCSCPRIFGGKIYRMHLLIDEAIINQINTSSDCVLLLSLILEDKRQAFQRTICTLCRCRSSVVQNERFCQRCNMMD